MDEAEIFDRRRRRIRRDRAATLFVEHDFLRARMADELLERLESVTRSFTRALDLGCFDGSLARALRAGGIDCIAADAGFAFARAACGVQCDEDRLPFADRSFDLVMSAGVLDSVNDLPGALSLIRRVLKPDGLFLGAFVGAGSLPRLRETMLAADGDRARARVHPQIDTRSAGDLLQRAGFALPVADGEQVRVRYSSLLPLAADLRGSASTNLLRGAGAAVGREALRRGIEAFARAADTDGRTSETIEIVYLSGWAPDPSQPKAAKPGSATASLADALRPRG